MNLRLHPRSVAPAEGPEKCGPHRPTRSGYSCNNAPPQGLHATTPRTGGRIYRRISWTPFSGGGAPCCLRCASATSFRDSEVFPVFRPAVVSAGGTRGRTRSRSPGMGPDGGLRGARRRPHGGHRTGSGGTRITPDRSPPRWRGRQPRWPRPPGIAATHAPAPTRDRPGRSSTRGRPSPGGTGRRRRRNSQKNACVAPAHRPLRARCEASHRPLISRNRGPPTGVSTLDVPGAPPVRRPACRPASFTTAAAPPPAT